MKRLCATTAALLIVGGTALAQSGGSSGPGTPTPGITTPSPPNSATTGRGPGNPSNPQDMIGRSNPQDMTSPGAKNPQDRRGSVPKIVTPQR